MKQKKIIQIVLAGIFIILKDKGTINSEDVDEMLKGVLNKGIIFDYEETKKLVIQEVKELYPNKFSETKLLTPEELAISFAENSKVIGMWKDINSNSKGEESVTILYGEEKSLEIENVIFPLDNIHCIRYGSYKVENGVVLGEKPFNSGTIYTGCKSIVEFAITTGMPEMIHKENLIQTIRDQNSKEGEL
jgi:hypothetical protein